MNIKNIITFNNDWNQLDREIDDYLDELIFRIIIYHLLNVRRWYIYIIKGGIMKRKTTWNNLFK